MDGRVGQPIRPGSLMAAIAAELAEETGVVATHVVDLTTEEMQAMFGVRYE